MDGEGSAQGWVHSASSQVYRRTSPETAKPDVLKNNDFEEYHRD
jgi:hypothetical protein